MKNSYLLIGLFIIIGIIIFFTTRTKELSMKITINSPKDIPHVFLKTVHEVEQSAQQIKKDATEAVNKIIAIPDEKRTFENTARALDKAAGQQLSVPYSAILLLSNIGIDETFRKKLNEILVDLHAFIVDTFGQNVELYKAFKAYVEGNAVHENLNDEERYYLKETMHDFKKAGLHLSKEVRDEVKSLEKKLSELSLNFEDNISTDSRSIIVSREELDGMDEDFINNLQKTNDGQYILKTDYPTYFPLMDYCNVAETRKKLYHLFVNRAYPQNKSVLNEIVALRDQLAHLLGFESYAALNIDHQMAKTPGNVKSFLQSIITKALVKEREEFAQLKTDLPPSIFLDDGKLSIWDVPYVKSYFKKKHFNIDKREIATYFPLEKTINGLIGIYEKFFDLSLKEITLADLWDKEVRAIQVSKHEKGKDEVLGYLLLDLYPRANKFTHACAASIIPALKTAQGRTQALVVVLANLPPSTKEKPSLLTLEDVTTFFHECGHAFHAILGATEMASFSGTSVKTDFVEMPSQMLEEWLSDAHILKKITSHFKTGQPMSDELIDMIIQQKNFSSGAFLLQQLIYSFLSLDYFADGPKKDFDKIQHELKRALLPHYKDTSDNHMSCSFGHLIDYGARYYGYLWARVFALDLFDYIKKCGLLNQDIGKRYVETILAPGGSKPPHQLLVEFLGREPNEKAFFESLGL